MRMTIDEIRLVAFIVLGLLVGATVKHWRDVQRALNAPAAQQSSAPADGAKEPSGLRTARER